MTIELCAKSQRYGSEIRMLRAVFTRANFIKFISVRSGRYRRADQRLLRRSDEAAINFVFSQLTIGITSCQIAKARRRSGTLNDSAQLRRAEKALRAAEKFMWRLKLQHPVFDQIMALVERLGMELDSLKRDPRSDDLPY